MTLRIEQDSEYEGDDWWRWWAWIEGPDDELDGVDYVVYTLHPTFPKPVRKVKNRASKFRIETGGWGVFVLYAVCIHRTGEETHLEHALQFERPGGDPAPTKPGAVDGGSPSGP